VTKPHVLRKGVGVDPHFGTIKVKGSRSTPGEPFMTVSPLKLASWTIVTLAAAGLLIRPFRWPEALRAVSGGSLLVLFGLLPLADGWRA
jgi:hypothetical protein